MRHAKKRHQFNRYTSWHDATLKSLVRSILIYQSIKTTKSKALAVRPLLEKMVNLSKENTLAAKRRAFDILQDHKLVSLLFNEIGPRFAKRTGGYLRILGWGERRGDSAEMVVLELTEIKKPEIKKPKKEHKEHKKESEKSGAVEAETQETKPRTETAVKEEKHPEHKRPQKKFLGGIKNIFKKERDSL